ncbi:MAG: TetR/AcrR family transcriptional regulator [Burkholderiaceae bacterium]|jgi:AcrR family transcriptional regulator|nr:TetR/AcrR family transcriptional regulator [Burkholderiaceae bacterium]
MQSGPGLSKGVRAAKQSRSLLKHQALLEAGRRLLEVQDLGTLSVAQLTRDAGMAVGSFYSRFADKQAWFAELLRVTGEQVLADTAVLLASARWLRAPSERKVALIVRHVVDIHRTHRGIFRAAHFDSARSELYWPQLHGFGRRLADAVHQALHAHLRRVPARQRRFRVGVALQLVYGTLVNAVLHDPGPLKLADKQIEAELTRVFLGAVGLG